MTDQTNLTPAQLKKLAHDLRNHVFVLDMGLSSLELIRDDHTESARLVKLLRTEVTELAAMADALDAVADRDP